LKPKSASSTPACPVCSSPMVMRSAKKGSNAGSAFWGCSNYPRCKGTRAVD
jgi:restriction system protein